MKPSTKAIIATYSLIALAWAGYLLGWYGAALMLFAAGAGLGLVTLWLTREGE